MSWLRDALDAIQLKPRFLFGVFLLGLLLLVLPAAVMDLLGVTALRNQMRPWIGIVTLAAFAFWLVQLWPVVSGCWQRRHVRKAVLKRLDSLSDDERLLLAYCLSRNRLTVLLTTGTHEWNTATALREKGLLRQASGGHSILAVPFTVPELVWLELQVRRHEFLPSDNQQRQQLNGLFARLDRIVQGESIPSWHNMI